MRRLASAFLLGTLGAAALTGQAQTPAQRRPARQIETGVIRGRVLAAGTDSSLRNARVQVISDAGSLLAVFTDADGRFAIPALAAGQYRLAATKAGYLATRWGARDVMDPGTFLTLANGAAVDGIELRMPRAAAVSGRILDTLGEPVIGMRVTAEALAVGGSGPADVRPLATAITDDLGDYRLGGLPEGNVLVSVDVVSPIVATGGMAMTLAQRSRLETTEQVRTYYPGVQVLAQAQPIAIASGEERSSIDLVVTAAPPPRALMDVLMGGGDSLSQYREPPAILERRDRAGYTAAIRGRITRADGQPLPQTLVTLASDDFPGLLPAVVADAEGKYEFLKLPGGSYRVVASKAGYVTVEYGQRRTLTNGEPIEVRPGDTRDRVDIALPRPGAISGRIVDDGADPVEGAYVRVLQIRYESGQRRLVNVSGVGGRRTDDAGRYRIYGLEPGQYIVNAVVGQEAIPDQAIADLPGYAPTYFPGTPNPGEARFINLALSQQVVDADFSLSPVATARIEGIAVNAAGQPISGNLLLSPSRRSGGVAAMAVSAPVRANGGFEFMNVPPGEYVLQAFTPFVNPFLPPEARRMTPPLTPLPNPSHEGEFASLFVTVSGSDVTGVLIRTSAGSTIKGHVTVEGEAYAEFYSAIEISARPVDLDRSQLARRSPASAAFQPDLTFDMGGLSGPRLFRLTTAPRGWALKAVLVNGVDVTDRPLEFGAKDQSLNDLEVVLTNRVSGIAGTVSDTRGRPLADCAVVVFTADRQLWLPESRFMAMSKTQHDGTFNVSALLPGQYLVAAVDGILDGEWRDPDLLEALIPHATNVTLAEGQKLSVSPRLIVR